ncbi:DUF4099 domain-containing protein [Parabacteroides sp. BX2]|uniref:DUF4099 domain-containing protein n=1 Tax=Parabacteroides segnis TaxID=2763058 RepID=A0ABR7DWF4_9BACT|nr:DUF4099 domain-containing protein [Parabacteroides segnis]MBC5641849.1 DUF4099 domain-containing protein [Parabacteroides segnis]
MNRNRFSDAEIPSKILQKFGLTQEMIGDLPTHALSQIAEGYRSPVLPIEFTDEQGNTYKSRTRFSLYRTEDNRVDVLFYPQLQQAQLKKFSEKNRNKLQSDKAVIDKMTTADGKDIQAFLQIDKGTQQILYVPTPVIGRNLQVIADEFHLNNAELNCLQNGNPLTILTDDDTITVGVDLNESTGIRICAGDERKWNAEVKKDWEKYNYGCFGCWMMDEGGNLDYIPEEEYTDEMWEEMRRKGESRKSQVTTLKL